MSLGRLFTAMALSLALVLNCAQLAIACGPDEVSPIFEFRDSPDPPFEEFTRGKIGVLHPTMGRKTLFIAYRYANGGSFTGEEQRGLIDALRGKAPEDKGEDAIKAWINVRKEALQNDETMPAIYTEREYGGYDFFPNCTKSGFETATETLKDRTATYGANDPHVRAWLAAQDKVFQNCSGGSSIPEELGLDNPEWIRKDRDYQIAAAYFYSLKFDEARERFEAIAADNNSPWRQTADYLVARTLVRHASLSKDEKTKRSLYDQAERHLQLLLGAGGTFQTASQKLLNLVTYRLRPEERVVELGRILSFRNGNENLQQDLIDYVWLLDKFNARVNEEVNKRKEALIPEKERVEKETYPGSALIKIFNAVNEGELITIGLIPKNASGEADYQNYVQIRVKPDATESEIIELVEKDLGRKLTREEIDGVRLEHEGALKYHRWRIAPNQVLNRIINSAYDGASYHGFGTEKPELELFPVFLRSDELSDWILTFQSTDEKAYAHALSRWRETDSVVWLMTALSKAGVLSPQVELLLSKAEKVQRDSAAYPTIAYHRIRLRIAFGKKAEARTLLDDVLSTSDLLPVSSQNEFRELGLQLASDRTEFLTFSQRKPVAFYWLGRYGKISDLISIEKSTWNPDNTNRTKEEFDQDVEESYEGVLGDDDRFMFDAATSDVLNWHFSLDELADVGRDPALPNYLKLGLLLSAWTRAVLLKNEKVALEVAAEIIRLAPERESVFSPYLNARTGLGKDHAALYILLQFPSMSPYIEVGTPDFITAEEVDYDFATSWWCKLSETDYDDNSNEIPKVVAKPSFLSPQQLETARRERIQLMAMGNSKQFLGKMAIAWAKKSPADIRVPEALYIAAEANKSYKYGCDSWEHNENIVKEAETILLNRYPRSAWTARLKTPEN